MPRQRRREKLDGIDAEQIQDTLESPGWQLIRQRIERTLVGKIGELEKPSDEVTTAQLRGQIAGLRTALNVPDILLNEAKENRENG